MPTTQVSNLRVAKSGVNLSFSWNASTDLYQTHYWLRASNTAVPVPPPGTWPNNPNFSGFDDFTASPQIVSNFNAMSYFLITAVGPTSSEGPSAGR